MPSVCSSFLIAPCGMNCAICYAYLRSTNKCPGCRGSDIGKPAGCKRCILKNCTVFKNGKAKFCFSCSSFPCLRLKQLDKRYRTKYRMSMIENLRNISTFGIRKFVNSERLRWKCSECGGIVCVHKQKCFSCGAAAADL